jgi:hypothetical protein
MARRLSSWNVMLTTITARASSKQVMPLRPFIAAVLLLCLVTSTSPAMAQQPAAPLVGPVDLDRIRERLARSTSIFELDFAPDYRIFVATDDEDLRLKLAWQYDDDTITPGYVRPFYPIYHFEMQQMMLPRDFRAHLYPIGVPAGGLFRAVGDAMRDRRERAARDKVRQEAEALRRQAEAQRLSPGTNPGARPDP